jgi:phosphoglycerate kinase
MKRASAMNFAVLADTAVSNQRVFMRCDLNVPFDAEGGISDDTRIRASLPGIVDALQRGGRVMITSHLGRPEEGALRARDSLAPVARRLSALLGTDVPLIANWLETPFDVPAGRAVLLENCRGNPGEKANSAALATRMSRLCDVYVNDAFGSAHRAEATTEALARLAPVACAGPLMASEVQALARAMSRPALPMAAIVGGSKVSTKLEILHALARRVDLLVVGGGMANTFLKAAGHAVGKSLCEPGLVGAANDIAGALRARGATLFLPTDVVVATALSAQAEPVTRRVERVGDDEMILDFGPQSTARLHDALAPCRTVVWNGPLGVFEIERFSHGTRALAAAIAGSRAFTVAGGGDTVAAINQFGVADRIDYVSTAGGAFLEFLEGKSLPALAALEARAR